MDRLPDNEVHFTRMSFFIGIKSGYLKAHELGNNQPKSDGLQPKNDGLQPNSDGLQPTSHALQPKSDGFQQKPWPLTY